MTKTQNNCTIDILNTLHSSVVTHNDKGLKQFEPFSSLHLPYYYKNNTEIYNKLVCIYNK